MSEASLATQKFLRSLMIARPALRALVPIANIMDRHSRPEVFPCILIGEGQVVGDDIDCADLSEVFATLHVWTKEEGFAACKNIVGEVRRACARQSDVVDGFDLSAEFGDVTYLRDPGGEHSHAVITFNVLAEDTVGIL